MKKYYLIGALSLAAIFLLFNEMLSFTGGSPNARSGGAGEQTCATSSCHAGTPNSGAGLAVLSSNATNGEYVPGNTYTITAFVEETGRSKFGFQVLSGYNQTQDASVGTTTITNAGETKTTSQGNRRYVTHVANGTAGTDSRTWNFDWTAPASGTGSVTFFASFNATNSSSTSAGDKIYTTSLTLSEQAVSVEPLLGEDYELNVFPTLARETVHIDLETAKSQQINLQVVNLSGQVIYEDVVSALAGQNRFEVEVSGWENGLYFFRMMGNGAPKTVKVLKQ